MTILPVYEPYLFTRHQRSFYGEEGHRGRKEKMNAVIKKVATEYKLHFLDMHHIFEKIGNVGEESSSLIKNMANSNKTDGLHPTNDGYRTMAVAIYEKLKSIDAGFTRLVCFGDSITNGGGGVDGTSYPAYLKKLLGY
jgi:lysophospholipase L1-like esterase